MVVHDHAQNRLRPRPRHWRAFLATSLCPPARAGHAVRFGDQSHLSSRAGTGRIGALTGRSVEQGSKPIMVALGHRAILRNVNAYWRRAPTLQQERNPGTQAGVDAFPCSDAEAPG